MRRLWYLVRIGLALVALPLLVSLGCASGSRTQEHALVTHLTEELPCAPPTMAEGELLLAAGTPIPLRLKQNATSFNTSSGESLPFEVSENVRVGEAVVVPRGLAVGGLVWNSKRGTSGRVAGALGVEIRKLDLPDGRTVSLKAFLASVASPGSAQQILVGLPNESTTPWVGKGGITFVPLVISLFALASAATGRGGEAWLLQGMIATAQVRCDTAVIRAELIAPPVPEPEPTGSAVTAASLGPIVIPRSGRLTDYWSVRLEAVAPPRQVRIASIGSRLPPQVTGSSKIVSHGSWQEVRFPAWALVRLAVLDPSASVAVPVVLEGTLGNGSPFFASVTVPIQFEKS